MELFTSRVLLNKFRAFNVNINLPDELLIILDICAEGNPGLVQVILKDLLNSIKAHIGPVPKGYIISANDFAIKFAHSFPIIDIPEIESVYRKLWEKQKSRNNNVPLDNLCDTPDWWTEVMK